MTNGPEWAWQVRTHPAVVEQILCRYSELRRRNSDPFIAAATMRNHFAIEVARDAVWGWGALNPRALEQFAAADALVSEVLVRGTRAVYWDYGLTRDGRDRYANNRSEQ